MKNKSSSKGVSYRCLLYCIAILLLVMIPLKSFSQSTGELTTDSLVKMGFENVRWTDTPEERVYVVENSAYKIQALGIRKAVDIIQSMGLPKDKSCKLIVTNYNIPQVSLTYQPLAGDTTVVKGEDWKVSYDIGDSWNKVKKEKKKNSSLFKVDILVYPQLYFKNYIVTQIYQALLEFSPAVEVSLWPGMKFTGQIVFPVYNDGYGETAGKIHPGYLTLAQKFRLPYNIQSTVTIGMFDYNTYGADLNLFYPFKDERFSLEGRIGYVGFPPQIFSRSDGAAGFPIERIAHGIKNGGFPCAGRAADEEKRMIFQNGKIHILFARIRAKSADPESFRSHQSSSFRRSSHNSFM